MKREVVLGVLTLANFVLLAGIAATGLLPSATAQDVPRLLRGSGLEIVDPQGRLRASISIQPAADESGETVLLRLINGAGQPSAKISATEQGAGLSFVGGDDLGHAILQAEGRDSSLKLVEGGRERLVEP